MSVISVMIGNKLRYVSQLEKEIIILINKEKCLRAGSILDNFFKQIPNSGITQIMNSLVNRGFLIKERIDKECLNNSFDDFCYKLPDNIQTLVSSNFRKC